MPFGSEIKNMLNKSWLYKAAKYDRQVSKQYQEAQYQYQTAIAQSLTLRITIRDAVI
jgi:hypothetical protein